MIPEDVTEQQILDALHRLPRERWRVVLAWLTAWQDEPGEGNDRPIRTAEDVLNSGLVGLWADRTDITDSREFARRLRYEAEHRRGPGDAGGQ
jgi:hypothetical protein